MVVPLVLKLLLFALNAHSIFPCSGLCSLHMTCELSLCLIRVWSARVVGLCGLQAGIEVRAHYRNIGRICHGGRLRWIGCSDGSGYGWRGGRVFNDVCLRLAV